MLPVMFYARSLDGEDPNIVLMLRCSYGLATVLTAAVVMYIRLKMQAEAKDTGTIYVPKAPGMFEPPDGPKKYTKSNLDKLQNEKLQELIQSSGMSVLMTVGLHYYKGMVIGLAMQSVMGPFGLYENPLVQKYIFGSKKDGRYFSEKKPSEITDEDSIVEMVGMEEKVIKAGKGSGLTDSVSGTDKKNDDAKPAAIEENKGGKKSFEDVLLDTWDMAAEANLPALTKVLTRGNVNNTTLENKWTPLMVICGLKGAAGVSSAVAECAKLGADEAAVDVEGWTALHWAAFHGSADAARALCDNFDIEEIKEIKDKEGKTIKMLCEEEKNMDVWKVIDESGKGKGAVKRASAE